MIAKKPCFWTLEYLTNLYGLYYISFIKTEPTHSLRLKVHIFYFFFQEPGSKLLTGSLSPAIGNLTRMEWL